MCKREEEEVKQSKEVRCRPDYAVLLMLWLYVLPDWPVRREGSCSVHRLREVSVTATAGFIGCSIGLGIVTLHTSKIEPVGVRELSVLVISQLRKVWSR